MRILAGLVLGILVSLGLVYGHGRITRPPLAAAVVTGAHVREDGGELKAILVHHSPGAAVLSVPIYSALLRALPATTTVHVACTTDTDCAALRSELAAAGVPHLERLRPVIVGAEITTWSRDRFAARHVAERLEVLAPPRTATPFEGRAGDGVVPFALGRTLGVVARTAAFAFEGGDLASTGDALFVDVNLLARQQAWRPMTRAELVAALRAEFSQEVVFLGQRDGDVPQHHLMMYAAPLGGRRVLVGDPAWGARLLDADPAARDAVPADRSAAMAARFERAADELKGHGFEVLRAPVVVL
jgi:hypothetical protein